MSQMTKPTKKAISDELELRKNIGQQMSNIFYNLAQLSLKDLNEEDWEHWKSLMVPLYRSWDLINHGS